MTTDNTHRVRPYMEHNPNHTEIVSAAGGDLRVHATRGITVMVEADDYMINGVAYRFNGHVWLWADGVWRLGAPDRDGATGNAVWTARNSAFYGARLGSFDGMTPSARIKAMDIIESAAREFVRTHPAALRAAEVVHLNNEARRIEAEIAELEIKRTRLLDNLGVVNAQIISATDKE